MKRISTIDIVMNDDGNDFFKEVRQLVDKLEAEGLEVEIQYSYSKPTFTAMVLGRKEGGATSV